MTERKFIEKLHTEKSDYKYPSQAEDVACALDSLSTDIYTDSIRFLFELIQNADDAGAKAVVINVEAGCIAMGHDGKPFAEEDVKALCSIGAGTKRADPDKTGYKGIGFKSVFGKSKHVAVFSQGFQFRFGHDYRHPNYPDTRMPWQIIPLWAEKGDYPAHVFDLPETADWKVITVIEMPSTGKLQKDLTELIGNGEVLLFLRHVLAIHVVGEMKLSIVREELQKGHWAIKKNGRVTSEWITHTVERIPIAEDVRNKLKSEGKKNPEKLQEAKFTEISFAAKLEKGRIKRLTEAESLIYTYLPTKVTKFGFPFLINASFLTNAGREELHDDWKWNEWLMEQAGEKIIEWLALLAKTEPYSDQILLLLPSESSTGGSLARHFHQAFEQHAREVAFIPGRNGKLLKASETLVDKTGLSEAAFISPEAVVDYFNSAQGTKLDVGSFIRTSVRESHSLKRLHAHFFELEDFETFVTSEVFRTHHAPDQNYELIKYLRDKARNSPEWTHRLRSIPFIYAKGNKLRPPGALCFPTMEYENEFGEGVTLLHKVVYAAVEKDREVREWLETMGVKEPSDDAYLENEILGNIHSCITEKNYMSVTRFLFERSRNGELTMQQYKTLHSLKLRTTMGVFREAQSCFLADRYEPRLRLERIHEIGQYVSLEYVEAGDLISEWKSFLLRVGVAEDLSITKIEKGSRYALQQVVPSKYLDMVYENAKSQANKHELNNKHAIEKGYIRPVSHLVNSANEISLSRIQYSEYAHEISFSKIFWEHVINGVSVQSIETNAQLHWGHYGSTWNVPNYIPWSFQHEAIFPAKNGRCYLASEVFVNHDEILSVVGDILPVFDCSVTVTQDWLQLIPFKTKLELDDYLAVLEHMAQQNEDERKDRKQRNHRLGLIYAKLAKELPQYPKDARSKLKAWAESNVLLSSDGEFVPVKELRWVKGSKRIPDGRVRTLSVPENCPADEQFEQLLHELGIGVIDKSFVDASDKREDAALQARLKALVPFMALVASKKQAEELSETLERLMNKVAGLKLHQCSALSLSFVVGGQKVPGEPMRCHRDGPNIYYAGCWSSKSIVYELVPELAKAMGVPKLHMDLLRLLESDLNEIAAFMDELGVNVEELPADVWQAAVMELSPEDEDLNEENIPTSSKNHLAQAARNEANREARELVLAKLTDEGFDTSRADARHSVVNGVFKDGVEYPLVIKSYRNTSFKFNIRPNEWLQLAKENAMFWVRRGDRELVVLRLEDLLGANRAFHVQFETQQFGWDGMVKFAEAFHYVRNVHFQLDAPDFRVADALDEYRFNVRTDEKLEKGGDTDQLLH